MARGKKTEEVKKWYEGVEVKNSVQVVGMVRKIDVDSDKLLAFNLEVATPTPKGNMSFAWVEVKSFDYEGELKEGDVVGVEGKLNTSSYENKAGKKVYTLDLVADKIIK